MVSAQLAVFYRPKGHLKASHAKSYNPRQGQATLWIKVVQSLNQHSSHRADCC